MKKPKTSQGKQFNPYIRSFQLSKELYETMKSLTELDFPFPLGGPQKKSIMIRWLEAAFAWYIASALRREISAEQVDRCLSPSDVFCLWLAFVEAKHGTKGYEITSDKKVTTPEGTEPERARKWGIS